MTAPPPIDCLNCTYSIEPKRGFQGIQGKRVHYMI